MDEAVVSIVVGLVIAAVVAFSGAVWRRRPTLRQWLRTQLSLGQRMRDRRRQRKIDEQVEVALREAETAGKPVPVTRGRGMPTKVVYSDGSTRYFFCYDLEAYKDALSRGEYPRDMSFHTPPPLTIRERVAKAIEAGD